MWVNFSLGEIFLCRDLVLIGPVRISSRKKVKKPFLVEKAGQLRSDFDLEKVSMVRNDSLQQLINLVLLLLRLGPGQNLVPGPAGRVQGGQDDDEGDLEAHFDGLLLIVHPKCLKCQSLTWCQSIEALVNLTYF